MYVDPTEERRTKVAADKLWQRLLQSTPHPDEWCTGFGAVMRDDRMVIEVRVVPQFASGIMQLALAHIPCEADGFPVVIVPHGPAVAR